MKKTLLLTSALLLGSWPMCHAQLVINEFMQSNIDLIMDDLNDFPDSWVELYNAGTEAEELGQYSISDSGDAVSAYKLPSQKVGIGQRVLIYCDKVGEGMHASFRLESSKKFELHLFKDNTEIESKSGLKKQPAPNIAYGRDSDGSDKWGYELTPTPGQPNQGGVVKDSKILGNPVFSEVGSVESQSKSHQITLSLPEGSPEGTEIRYTTDCSEPTATSTLYSNPITLSNGVIRAKLFCKGYLSPRSTTHSYLALGRNVTLPVVSIVTNQDYFYDSKIGIFYSAKQNNGWGGVTDVEPKNYNNDWRRPINLELFETSGTESVLNQLGETRVQGGATRGNAIKSLALYANKRFGQSRLSYEFFPDQRPGQTNFKSLILRNSGNDFDYLYMRDPIIQRTMVEHGVDLDWQAWRPAIVFINGKYIGIENFRERSNEDNIFTNYNELEDIDMFENWNELKVGDWENYNAFKTFYTQTGHTMAEYEQWMDCQEFINLMAMNLYYCNLDFPGNNIVMWRPHAEGGRWRWIAKDTDFGLGLYGRSPSYNTIEWIYNNNYDKNNAWGNTADATRLFRRLMADPDFNREFLDHCAIYMGDFMNERGTREVWDPMYDIIKFEYPYHRKLINEWWPNYNDELSNARNWVKKRTDYFYTMLKDYYKLGNAVPLLIEYKNAGIMLLEMNGIKIATEKFDGKFFAGRQLTITGSTGLGSSDVVKGWKLKETSSAGTKETIVEGDTYTFTMPDCTKLEIIPIVGDPTAIEQIETATSKDDTILDSYNVNGVRQQKPQKGINLIRLQNGEVKKILY